MFSLLGHPVLKGPADTIKGFSLIARGGGPAVIPAKLKAPHCSGTHTHTPLSLTPFKTG